MRADSTQSNLVPLTDLLIYNRELPDKTLYFRLLLSPHWILHCLVRGELILHPLTNSVKMPVNHKANPKENRFC